MAPRVSIVKTAIDFIFFFFSFEIYNTSACIICLMYIRLYITHHALFEKEIREGEQRKYFGKKIGKCRSLGSLGSLGTGHEELRIEISFLRCYYTILTVPISCLEYSISCSCRKMWRKLIIPGVIVFLDNWAMRIQNGGFSWKLRFHSSFDSSMSSQFFHMIFIVQKETKRNQQNQTKLMWNMEKWRGE